MVWLCLDAGESAGRQQIGITASIKKNALNA